MFLADPTRMRLAGLAAACLMLGACAAPPPPATEARLPEADLLPRSIQPGADPLKQASEAAADTLHRLLLARGLEPNLSLVVAQIAPLDELQGSSPLGRALAEQVAGRLTQLGLQVREARLREAMLISPREGEQLLSRDLAKLATQQEAQAALVGTYQRSADLTRVSLRIVRLADATALAAVSFDLGLDERNELIRGAADERRAQALRRHDEDLAAERARAAREGARAERGLDRAEQGAVHAQRHGERLLDAEARVVEGRARQAERLLEAPPQRSEQPSKLVPVLSR
ncbi:hypothetical protein JI742_04995 [Piscinibacter sp. Jin2]|uniref:FlgO domain-containing protein n=1 Tax=Aquariibacter lacus TaxID=2801332 RepID=A0A9X0XE91_9BURK|nr:FlgO family outer membrane protein [Piscinibacter lacus]MBL0719242.1 hypothetical protein [Piscinibacter lacus]